MLSENRFPGWLFSLIFMVMLSLFTPSAAFSSNAVFLLVKGKVGIRLHGTTFPAKSGLRFQTGVTVESMGGTAAILLSDGSTLHVGESEHVAVPEIGEEDARDPLIEDLMDTIRETAHRGRVPASETGEDDEGRLTPVYPCNSFVTPDEQRFEWTGPEGVGDLVITLNSPSPVFKYAFRYEGDQNQTSLPDGAPGLLRDVKYYWRVKGFHRSSGKPYASPLCWFSILGEEKSGALRTEMERIGRISGLDENDLSFLKAGLFISHGLYHSAAELLMLQSEKFPQDEGLREILIGVLRRMNKDEDLSKQ